MKLNHSFAGLSHRFDEPNLVRSVGVVPVVGFARSMGLSELADNHLRVPGDKGANASGKVMTLVAGMADGADTIDGMNVLRHGGMRKLFNKVYAPSSLGSFLRGFTFGHVRQLDAVASRFLVNLDREVGFFSGDERVIVDLDDTIVEVYGHKKQGAEFGYSGTRGLNVLLATACVSGQAPVILSHRLRRGAAHSSKGVQRMVFDCLANVRRMNSGGTCKPLLRADSAFYGSPILVLR